MLSPQCFPLNIHGTIIKRLQVVCHVECPVFPLNIHGTTISFLQVVVSSCVPSTFFLIFMAQPPTCCRLLCHVECPALSSQIHGTIIKLLQVVVPCWVPSADACSVVWSSHCSSTGRKQQQPLPPLRQPLHRHMNISRTIRRNSKKPWTTRQRNRRPILRVSLFVHYAVLYFTSRYNKLTWPTEVTSKLF